MPKITTVDRKTREIIKAKTTTKSKAGAEHFNWWKAKSKEELKNQVLDTAAYLKDNQQYRFRQASIHARMYGNMPIIGVAGTNMTRLGAGNSLPMDRPTMNVVQSCVDTLVSRLSQNKPRPLFLTDNGDYKQRNLADQMNSFIMGEFYQTKAYEKGELIMRDAAVTGTGCLKIFEQDNEVRIERTLLTELYVDPNDAFYGEPRTLYQFKLVDRSVLAEHLPEYKSEINKAEQAYPDQSDDSTKTVSDQVMVCEAWHLPSGKDATDGRHTIVCSAGVLCDDEYDKPTFPFVFLSYSPRLAGFWAQGLSEQLLGTQVEINKLLMTITQSINLVGVPRVFVEDGSKVVKAHLNDKIGAIVTYRGTKPEYTVAPCVPQELYAQLQRLIDYAYQQSGISALAAASTKPAGLDSGVALREYDDLQSDRFASLEKRYAQMYIDLAYLVIDLAKDIAEREGKYETIYPNKDATQQIDLPDAKLLDNKFIIQCFDSSMLPRDPAGRLQMITEMMQSGLVDPAEGRRLMGNMDLAREDKMANAAEERICKQLDDIVQDGKYSPPDPYTNIQLALKKVTEYYNLYTAKKLEESKAQMLRNYHDQLMLLMQAAMPPAPPMAPGGAPIGVPQAPPQSDMMPIGPQQ